MSFGLLLVGSGALADPHRGSEPVSSAPSEEQLPRLRPVLRGVLYRSGTPSEEALNYLCESGWKRVYSLYGEFTTQLGPRNVNMLRHGRDQRQCNAAAGPRQIEWRPAPSSRMRNLPAIFQDILDSIRNPEKGPVLVHCWNGLHYAGMVSALALRQFCGLSPQQAEAYWRANANRGANYPLIIANLYSFKPLPSLTLTAEEQQVYCPNLSKSYLVTPEAFAPVDRSLEGRNATVASNVPVPPLSPLRVSPASYGSATRDPRIHAASPTVGELPVGDVSSRVPPTAPLASPSQASPPATREATRPSAPAKG
ncbi:MAG: hypothetical protein E6Q99_08790 [Elusimicrobia bacterium]|nr:MAG: hypothetical protein E6Q99_08790 [Elusimicrobiota bacterium]